MSDKTAYETRFVISMMPAHLEQEVNEMLALIQLHPRAIKEETVDNLSWWQNRSASEFEELAETMMQDDAMWEAWRRNFFDSLRYIRAVIEEREAKE